MPEHTIAENLQRLVNAKENIGKAITAKGGIVNSGDGLEEYPNDISTIKNELTSININENGIYSNGIEDTISTNNYPIIINANGDNIKSIVIDGNSNQASTPTPTNPVDVTGVGERTGNLFDETNMNMGYWIASNGTVSSATYGAITNKLPLNDIDITVYFHGTIPYSCSICWYRGSSFISRSHVPYNVIQAEESFTAPNNADSFIFQLSISSTEGVVITQKDINGFKCMINEGSTPLPYEPYGIKIPISCGGVTTDVYLGEVETTRYIKKYEFTGNESIQIYTGAGLLGFELNIVDMMTNSRTLGTSTHFKPQTTGSGMTTDGITFGANNTILYVTLSQTTISTFNLSDISTIHSWLSAQYAAGTPVTVWYVLATPETATINEPLMKIGDYADQLTLTDSDITIPTISGNNTIDYDLILKPSNTQITYNKININKTITSDTLPITINSDGSNATISIKGNTVQNGTPTPDSPIQPNGCGERTNNLFDYISYFSSSFVTYNGYFNYADIQLIPNTTYSFSTNFNEGITYGGIKETPFIVMNGTDTPSTAIGGLGNNTIRILTTDNSGIVRILKRTKSNSTADISTLQDFQNGKWIMCNEGSTVLPYEPYGIKIPILNNSQTTNVYLGETQSTRRIKKLVLDGAENWEDAGTSGNNSRYRLLINNISSSSSDVMATHYKCATDFSANSIRLFSAGTNKSFIIISVPTTSYGSVTDFKSYLAQQYAAGTPVTVWYVLATPETGVVNEPLMKIGDYADSIVDTQTQIPTVYGDNTFDVGTTIKPSSVSITYDDINIIGYDEINVDVPNTYTVEDEGKVVNNATLVAQTAMPTEITANDTYDTTLYNSIVVNVPTGGSAGTKGDVTFYDYDGTIVQSYSAADFANLSELPTNPSHEGLTAQGWNWNLSDAKTYVNNHGKLDIGQMYITDDGKTRLYITLTEGRTSPILQLYLNANSELDIDWGDGSVHSTFTSTSADYVSERHNYSSPGDYVIAISVTTGSFVLQSSSTSVSSILWNGNNSSLSPDVAYNNSIQKIEIGTDVTSIGACVFYRCYSLTSITIPDSVTSIGNSAFQYCYSLSSITIPDTVTSIGIGAFNGCYSLSSITMSDKVTSIGRQAFYQCYSLTSITIPDGVTSIGVDAFRSCYSLTSITIPDSVTSIGNNAFMSCNSLSSATIGNSVTSIGMAAFMSCSSLASIIIGNSVTNIASQAFQGCTYMESIKFKSTTPPTVSSSNAWSSVPTTCTILVPINTFAAYTTATNYPNPSSFTYLVYGTYASGDTLPSTSTDNYSLTWYATTEDAIAQTNPITTGNGNEVYARCTAI